MAEASGKVILTLLVSAGMQGWRGKGVEGWEMRLMGDGRQVAAAKEAKRCGKGEEM
jgi:hypothetical protein